MQRRTLLAGLAGTLGVLGGCGGTEDADDDAPAGGPPPERTATPTRTPTATPRPGSVPATRVLGESATAADGLRVRVERWFARDSVRYLPAGTATPTDATDLPTVEPRRGRFVGYDFVLTNTGTERLEAVRDSVFRLRVAGGTFRHVHRLRDVPFRRLRQQDGVPRIRPLAWYEGLDPGESVRLQLVFDAPDRPAFRHYLAWDHPTPVAGFDAPVYLWPDGRAAEE